MRDHIIKNMKENNLFSPKQFGFIEGRSTTLQLLHVLDIWTEILDQGGTLDVVYCDFMKAFDKVPHQRLHSDRLEMTMIETNYRRISIIYYPGRKNVSSNSTRTNVFPWQYQINVVPPQNEYYMANNLIQGSECEKDIGVYIDNKLNFDKHINHIVTKANSAGCDQKNLWLYGRWNFWPYIQRTCATTPGICGPRMESQGHISNWQNRKYTKESYRTGTRACKSILPRTTEKLKLPTLA